MSSMYDLAIDYMNSKHKTSWFSLSEDKSAFNLLDFLISGKLYSGDYRQKIGSLIDRDPKTMNLEDVELYLTALAKQDRINDGLFTESVANGLVGKLVSRWLDLQ